MSGVKQVFIQIILDDGRPLNMLGLLMPVSRQRLVYRPMVVAPITSLRLLYIVFIRRSYRHLVEWIVVVVAPFKDVIMEFEMSGVVCRIHRKSTPFHWAIYSAS